MRDNMKHNSKNGFITLISVLLLGAVGLAITVSLLLLGLSSSRTSFSLEQGTETSGIADTCAEDALERLRKNPSFTGTVSFPLYDGTCSYTISGAGLVQVTGTKDDFVRRIEITVTQTTPSVVVGAWEEVGTF